MILGLIAPYHAIVEDANSCNPSIAPPKTGEPLLHRAAREGDNEFIRRLVADGADIEALFDIGLCPDHGETLVTPLMVAAGSGDGADVRTVDLLLELGADPKRIVQGCSSFTFACEGLGWHYQPGGDAARARRLVDAGSPLETRLKSLSKLLCVVAGAGDPERVALLLSHSAPVSGDWNTPERLRIKQSVMEEMRARSQSQENPFESAPAEMRDFCTGKMQEILDRINGMVASAPASWDIPLFCAASSGSAACVRILLESGADVKINDSGGRTAMFYAASKGVLDELAQAGLCLDAIDSFGHSPLLAAVMDGESGLDRIRAFIAAGVDVNATRDHGYSVFMSAVGSNRHPDVLRLLIEAGANPHAVSEYGWNAFHAAVDVNFEANAEESVRDTFGLLKELKVDIEHSCRDGNTPLGRAIESGTALEVEVLCELGANPNAIGAKRDCVNDEWISTPLPLLFVLICGMGVHKDQKLGSLLRAGANPLISDEKGLTPLQYAAGLLCADAPDAKKAMYEFLHALPVHWTSPDQVFGTRDEFMGTLMPKARAFVERFANAIPIPQRFSEFDEQWRLEKIGCITLLIAYEVWARRERGQPQLGFAG